MSWSTILKKREGYRRAFANFDIDRIAEFDDSTVQKLLQDEGIVRNRLKIQSVIKNAKVAKKIQEEHGSLSSFLWSFIPDRRPIQTNLVDNHTFKVYLC